MAVCYGVVILIAVGLYNIIARILLLKTVLIWRGVGASDGAAGGRSEGQGLVFFLSKRVIVYWTCGQRRYTK